MEMKEIFVYSVFELENLECEYDFSECKGRYSRKYGGWKVITDIKAKVRVYYKPSSWGRNGKCSIYERYSMD